MRNLRILGDDGVKAVHEASLRILAETGIRLGLPEAKALLLEHGAREKGGRLLLPEELVQDSLSRCPRTVSLRGRKSSVTLGGGSLLAHNVGGVPRIQEGSGASRPAVREDNVRAARLLDALPNADSATPLFTPGDVPSGQMELWMYYDTLRGTTKPVRGPGLHSAAEVRVIAEIAAIAGVDATADMSPISPLEFPDGIAEAVLEGARRRLPVGPLPCPIAGLSAPMSLAGGLAQQNAEVLACIALAQAAEPGLPVVYHGRFSVMDPYTACSVWGSPELGLAGAAAAELGRHYGLPVNVYGLCTNSHRTDFQSGYERALNALLPALAGADEVSGMGELDCGKTASLSQMVADDELLASVRRIRRGIGVDEDSLAVGVLADVVGKSGSFMTERHTALHLRRELLIPGIAVREERARWEAGGSRGLAERAEEKARSLLDGREAEPLEEERRREIERLISAVGWESG